MRASKGSFERAASIHSDVALGMMRQAYDAPLVLSSFTLIGV